MPMVAIESRLCCAYYIIYHAQFCFHLNISETVNWFGPNMTIIMKPQRLGVGHL